jgi:cell division protein FtsL
MRDLFNGSNDFKSFSKVKKILYVLFIYLGIIVTIFAYFTAIYPLIYIFTK